MNNIYLIGMPGCGKTTIGMEVAAKLGVELIDLDRAIVEREGRTIPEIFEDGEAVFRKAETEALKEIASKENSLVLPISAKIESEIAELDDEEKMAFLNDLGINESGLDRLIKASYKLLGLMSYLTAGEPETRAWTIKIGTKAPQAAGKIHSDFERGFIRAEVISYEDLIACGSMMAAKEKGLVRSEGKEYVFQDGDIVLFRFNV